MDNYLDSFREMISLRGLTDHTLKNYCTYIRAYLDYLANILHKSPEDVSWDELRNYIRWLQKSRCLSDRTINCAISQLRFFTIYVNDYCASGHFRSDIQQKAAHAILNCKSGRLGVNLSQCTDCGHVEIHNNSCRNRNCPNCQAVLKEIWVDKRRAEVIDSPYFHVVFTLPHELNPLLYCNQKLLYGLLHRCCAKTLLELSADKKWLGATPGIIQVLHTWNREPDYHVHMHCIVSGGGLTKDGKIRKSSKNFFIRTEVLRDKFKGKYMAHLASLYESGSLAFLSCFLIYFLRPAFGRSAKHT